MSPPSFNKYSDTDDRSTGRPFSYLDPHLRIQRREILIYRGIYGRKFPPQQIPFQHLTHINYAFANVNKESGTVALSDTWADVEVSSEVQSPVVTGSYFSSRI